MLRRVIAVILLCIAYTGHAVAQQPVTFDTTTTCPSVTLSNGNLTASFVAPAGFGDDWIAPVNALVTIGSKVYFEFVQSSYTPGDDPSTLQIGAMNLLYVINCGTNSFPGDGQGGKATGFISENGGFVVRQPLSNVFLASWTATPSNIGVALDLVNKKVWIRVNGGLWNNSGAANPATNAGGVDITPAVVTAMIPFVIFRDHGGGTLNGQFASSSWTYAAPSGFSQLPPGQALGSIQSLQGVGTVGLKGTTASGGIYGGVGPVTFDITTSFGALSAACNGIANDDPAFANAHALMVNDPRVKAGADVTLIVPSGSHCIFNTCSVGAFASGLNNFTLIMTGATFNGSGGGCEQWGNGSIVSGTSPLINTVSAGASCVTTITPADAASFTPGRWAMPNGLGMQGSGFPMNLAAFEYVQVVSNNPSTGQVCFTSNLVNAYKSTWTDLGNTNCSNNPCGGAGRLQLMQTDWGNTINFIGGTWELWAAPLFYPSRIANFTDVTWISTSIFNQNCFVSTFSGTITFNNSTIVTCDSAGDKEVENWVINNSTLDRPFFESSSFHTVTLNTSTVTSIDLTPQHTICNNSTIGSITFGNDFGTPKSFSGTNCHLTGAITLDGNANGGFGTGYNGANINGPYSYTATGGVIQVCCSATGGPGFNPFSPPNFWEPGTVAIFSNQNHFNAGFPFTITNNSCVDTQGAPPCIGGHLSINTTLSDANLPPAGAVLTLTTGAYISSTGIITLTMPSSINFNLDQFVTLDTLAGTGAFASLNGTWATKAPTTGNTVTLKGPVGATTATISGGNVTPRMTSFHSDAMRDWACSNCDGTPKAVDLSQAPAQHQPLFTYSSRTYTCTANLPNVPNSDDLNHATGYNMLGNFVSATINVLTPDTSAFGSVSVGTDQFGQIPNINQVTGVNSGWGYAVNAKITGTRAITTTAVSGAQAGDSGTFPGANSWLGMAPGGTGIFTSQDLTTQPAALCPVVSFTFQTTR